MANARNYEVEAILAQRKIVIIQCRAALIKVNTCGVQNNNIATV